MFTYFFLLFTGSSIFEDHAVPGCEASDWSSWSACSVTCGKGISMRTRTFLVPERPKCWDATGKWSREKCALLLFHYVKVVTFSHWANLHKIIRICGFRNFVFNLPTFIFTYFPRLYLGPYSLMVFYKCPF